MIKDCGLSDCRLTEVSGTERQMLFLDVSGRIFQQIQTKTGVIDCVSGFLRSRWIGLTLHECRGRLDDDIVDGKQIAEKRSEESGTACLIW